MRKVLYKKWIPREYIKSESAGGTIPKPGTNCWGPIENKGFFHCWGLSSVDGGDSVATDSVAIIELEDGTVERVAPEAIQFVD